MIIVRGKKINSLYEHI